MSVVWQWQLSQNGFPSDEAHHAIKNRATDEIP
jgi:hypothetical protein